MNRTDRQLLAITLLWGVALMASGWTPHDRATWWMEVAPALIVLPILVATRRRLPLTGLALGQGADEFPGTQGDPWDAQWDMLLGLVGAILALVLLGRRHDRSLAALFERSRNDVYTELVKVSFGHFFLIDTVHFVDDQ